MNCHQSENSLNVNLGVARPKSCLDSMIVML